MNESQQVLAHEASHAMKIQREVLTEKLFAEIMPLGQKSWDECSEIKGETCSFHGERGFQIQPNERRYLEIEAAGSMAAITMRDAAGILCGYALCIFYHSLHHAPVQCANVDTFYIEPEHRACMRRFIATMEQEFFLRGVVVIGWPTSPSGKLFPILKLLGYAPDDVVMEKRLSDNFEKSVGEEKCALQPQ